MTDQWRDYAHPVNLDGLVDERNSLLRERDAYAKTVEELVTVAVGLACAGVINDVDAESVIRAALQGYGCTPQRIESLLNLIGERVLDLMSRTAARMNSDMVD